MSGEFPRDPALIRSLPGVGDYMAGALLSLAFNQPAPILETNSERVLTRLVALREDPRRATSRRRLWDAAEQLVPANKPGDFNQALMDLGRHSARLGPQAA